MSNADWRQMNYEADILAVDGLIEIVGIDNGNTVAIVVVAPHDNAVCEMISAEVQS